MRRGHAYLVMFISIPLLWLAAVKLTGFPPFLLPPPDMVAKVLFEEARVFASHTGITLSVAAIGYLIANLLAISFAVSFLYVSWLEDLALPWMVMIKNVPFVTIASILIIVLGDTPVPKIMIVVLICFFPIVANVTKGLKSADQVILDRMQSLNASRWQIFTKVLWPTALPYYIASHEISLTGSIIGAIVAEWMFASRGLGFLIVRSMMQYRADKVYAVTIIASFLAIGAYLMVRWAENRLFRWKEREVN